MMRPKPNPFRLVWLLGVTFIAAAGYYDVRNAGPTLDPQGADPKIFGHAGLDFAPYNSSTMLAGAVIFDPCFNVTHIKENRVFKSFGLYSGANDMYGPNAEYVYNVDTNADVYATVNGTVQNIGWTHANDWGIMIFPHGYGSEYMVGIDHVLNVTVSVGDNVTAGQVVAKPGYLRNFSEDPNHDPFHDDQLYSLVEFSIAKYNYYLCPARYYTDSLLASYNQSLNRLMSDWENYIGDESVHNESAFVLPGCLGSEYPMINTNASNSGTANTCSTTNNYSDTNSTGCTSACPQSSTVDVLLRLGFSLFSFSVSSI